MTDEITTQEAIKLVMENFGEFLCEKNRRYGDSVFAPNNVFSKLSAAEQILIRIDDKIGRVKNSNELRDNDIADIMGYLVLLMVQRERLTFDDMLD